MQREYIIWLISQCLTFCNKLFNKLLKTVLIESFRIYQVQKIHFNFGEAKFKGGLI